jgi:ParB-like chromosome segregation protein Spo0J
MKADHSDVRVEMVSVHTLEQHPENPNNGDIDALVESIRTNGFYQPIVVQLSSRHIIAGNHRYVAALRIGMAEVPVVWRDVDNEAAKRIMLADNRVAELAYRDEAQLADLMESLFATDAGLTGTGYMASDMHDLLALIHDPLSPEDFATPDDDDAESADGTRKSAIDLKYKVVPTVSEDGKAYSLTITKTTGRSIGPNDFNMLLKALGQDPLSDNELAMHNVPSWERRR